MTRLLLKKYLHESWLLLVACASMAFIFCWARVWILCQFDLQRLEPLLEQLRPFEKFMPVPLEQLLTYSGGIAMTFHEPVLILCVLVWAIARGSDVVSGELNRGTLEMLLAQPVSRTGLLACHSAVCIGGLGLLCTAAWMGLLAGIQTNSIKERVAPSFEVGIPFLPVRVDIPIGASTEMLVPLSSRVDATDFLAPAGNLFGFAFFVYGLSVMFSSFDRYRWRTIGIVISMYVVQLLLFLLSKATEATQFFGYTTFLAAYQPDAIVYFTRSAPERAWWLTVPNEQISRSWPHSLGPLGLTLLLVALGSAFLAIAVVRFRTRDIPAPL